jgi:hypothetical protein
MQKNMSRVTHDTGEDDPWRQRRPWVTHSWVAWSGHPATRSLFGSKSNIEGGRESFSFEFKSSILYYMLFLRYFIYLFIYCLYISF